MFTAALLFRPWILTALLTVAAADAEIDARFQKWKAGLSPEQQAWEKTLEENLGSFYLPLYKRGRVTGQGHGIARWFARRGV